MQAAGSSSSALGLRGMGCVPKRKLMTEQNNELINNSAKKQITSYSPRGSALFKAGSDFVTESIPVLRLSPDVSQAEALGSDGEIISTQLIDHTLWSEFHAVTNEMIVTKVGRRMFPVLGVNIRGLHPEKMYAVRLEFRPASTHRLKFVAAAWHTAGEAEPGHAPWASYAHPDSPNFGSFWTRAPIQFSKLKLTNKTGKNDQVCLTSLRVYQPVVVVESVLAEHQRRIEARFTWSETQFVSVTAYQNHDVTLLKIKHNPAAKCFQEGSLPPGSGLLPSQYATGHSYATGHATAASIDAFNYTQRAPGASGFYNAMITNDQQQHLSYNPMLLPQFQHWNTASLDPIQGETQSTNVQSLGFNQSLPSTSTNFQCFAAEMAYYLQQQTAAQNRDITPTPLLVVDLNSSGDSGTSSASSNGAAMLSSHGTVAQDWKPSPTQFTKQQVEQSGDLTHLSNAAFPSQYSTRQWNWIYPHLNPANMTSSNSNFENYHQGTNGQCSTASNDVNNCYLSKMVQDDSQTSPRLSIPKTEAI